MSEPRKIVMEVRVEVLDTGNWPVTRAALSTKLAQLSNQVVQSSQFHSGGATNDHIGKCVFGLRKTEGPLYDPPNPDQLELPTE